MNALLLVTIVTVSRISSIARREVGPRGMTSEPVGVGPSRGARVVGLGLMAVAVGLVAIATAALTLPEFPAQDTSDPGWGEIGFVVSPFLAAISAFVVGLSLVIAAAIHGVRLRIRDATVVAVVGIIGGPIVYLLLAITLGSVPAIAESSLFLPLLVFTLPSICGVGITLLAVRLRRYRPIEAGLGN
jgi:hypothetical protein